MQAIVAIILLLVSFSLVESQPISHQNWQNMTIGGDAINITCAPLLLPLELGRLLIENAPLQEPRGEMDQSLRAAHAVKVSLQPETGTSDQITSITGCTTNGARLQLSTVDAGDTITIVHTPGSIEFFGGTDVVLSSPTQILTLQRKAGIWVSDGGLGGAFGGNVEALATGCPAGQYPVSDGAGGLYCDGAPWVTQDCTWAMSPWELCLDWDATNGPALLSGDGTDRVWFTRLFYKADCTPYASAGDLCVDFDNGGLFYGSGEEAVALGMSGGAGTQTLDQAFDFGKIIDGAIDETNALVVGDGTNGFKFYVGSTGPIMKCFQGAGACDIVLDIPSGKVFRIKYNGTDGISIDSAGEVTLANNLIEYKSFWFGSGGLSTDATQCLNPEERQINGGPKVWTITCADNDLGVIYGSAGMPDSYSGGTVNFEMQAVNENAGASGNLSMSFSAYCRGDGDAINAVWGTPVAMTLGFTAQYAIKHSSPITVTPNGPCVAGDTLFWRATLNATSTTTQVANLYILGVKMEYPTNDWSDD